MKKKKRKLPPDAYVLSTSCNKLYQAKPESEICCVFLFEFVINNSYACFMI